MKKQGRTKFISIMLSIFMVVSLFAPINFGPFELDVQAAAKTANGKITNVTGVSVTATSVKDAVYQEECDGEDFKKLQKKTSNGISPYALSETVADTGLLKSSLTGLELQIYEALEKVHLTSENNGIEFVYATSSTFGDAWEEIKNTYKEALYAYEYDHLEELYWLVNNRIGASGKSTSQGYVFNLYFVAFENDPSNPAYTEALEAQAKAKISSAVSMINGYTSVYDKLYYANKWVVDNCEYGNLNAAEGSKDQYYAHSMMGLLIDGIGVCETYAKTFKILCQRMGLPCVVVISDNHAFDYVKIDGNWYMIDCTWNDGHGSYLAYFLCSNNPSIDFSHTPVGPLSYPATSTSDYVKASHNWDDGTVTKKASCGITGTVIFHCTDSECSETKTVEIPALEHKFKYDSTTTTCSTIGVDIYKCAYCDATKTQESTGLLNHVLNTDFSFDYNSDYSECDVYATCKLCGDRVLAGRGTVEILDSEEPTCTSDGMYYLQIKFSVKDGASTTNYTAKRTIYPDALGHDYQVTSTTVATCITDGKKTSKCSRCGDTKTETIAKTGHSYTKTTVAATCTTAGYDTYTCTKCNNSYTDNEKAALGHDYKEVERELPADGNNGYVKYGCTRCSESYTEILAASPEPQTIVVTKSGSTTALTKATLNAGKTIQLEVTGANTEIEYVSSDSNLATVSSEGLIKAVKPGKASITVKAKESGMYEASQTVTITIDVRPAVTSSLSAANVSTGIKLTWTKVANVKGYYIYCNDKKIGSASATAVTYTDKTKRTNGTKLTYKVVAYAENGASTSGKTVTTYYLLAPTISSLTNSAAKTMVVKYSKVSKNTALTGYQVQYSTSSSFGSVKTVTVSKNSTLSATIKSLTKGKTYYVRVRSYKKVSSGNFYSCWSGKKSLKITK